MSSTAPANSSPKTYPGFLISFEGCEGAGKTTQADLLTAKLKDLGKEVVVVREPGGTPVAEQIRDVVLSPKNENVGPITEVLLFQAARAQLYHEIVVPALEAGKFVLMDRTRDSSVVYQGIVREMGIEFIENLNDISTQNIYPDITILLDLDAKMGLDRRLSSAGKDADRIDLESLEFHQKVREAYTTWLRQTPNRWRVVDASRSIEEVERMSGKPLG